MISRQFSTYFLALIFFKSNVLEINSKNQENYIEGLRFKALSCNADNKTLFIKYCYLKAVSRKVVTSNVGMQFLVPFVKPIYLQTIVYYRYGTIFRQIIDTKKVEICGIIENIETNPLIKIIFDMIKNKVSNLIHKCPYTGALEVNNFTFNTELMNKTTMVFPQGIYRFDYFYFLKDASSLNVSGIVEVKSHLKESFG
ncbi:hypothetical protein ACKWTF_015805 [Chironomus riparius]